MLLSPRLLAPLAALAVAVSTAVVAPLTASAETAAPADSKPWLAPGLSTDQRVDALLSAMTLDEKIAELHADNCPPYESCVPANTRLGLPELVLQDDSTGVAAGVSHGVTALPASIAASATWDRDLVQRYGAVIGREERAKGVDVALAPTLNIARVPQWGRNFESLGEDPYLTGQLGTADMHGIQSQGILADVKHFAANNQETNRRTTSADMTSRTLHEIYLPAFAEAVHGGVGSVMASYNAINGVSNSENPYLLTKVLRDEMGFDGFVRSDGGGTYSTIPAAGSGLNIQVKGTDYFAVPLKDAVLDGRVSMATINSMVRPILRQMFQFHLFDHEWGQGDPNENVITPESTKAALDSAEQGTVLLDNKNDALPLSASDLDSVAVVGPDATPGKAEGSGSGYVNTPFLVSPVDGIKAAAPNADVSYARGLPAPESLPSIPAADLDPPYKAGNSYSGTLTPEVSGRYTLVAHNNKGYQPMTLSVDGKPVLTAAGTAGDEYGQGSVDLQAGHAYHVQIAGPTDSLAWATPSARSGAIGAAVDAARRSKVAVVIVGDQGSEAVDRIGLGLTGGQDALIEAVAAANPHTVVVLDTGGPVLMPWLDKVSGVVESWYSGEHDGTALADVLFGKVNPSGKLPMTFPAADDQVPASTPEQFPGVDGSAKYSEGLQVGYRWYDAHGVKPLFPFGHGLSYTSFKFSDLAVSPGSTTSLGRVQVGATVTNTGKRSGAEVAQLYVGFPGAAGEPPKQLKGFAKVNLAPGESTRVHFTLDAKDLATWDDQADTWSTADGTYRIMVGDSSASLPLTGSLQVDGTTGTRAVDVKAPDTISPGHPVTVTATMSPGGNLDLHGAKLALAAPSGWTVEPLGGDTAATLNPDQSMTARWRVTAPADTVPDHRRLTATATFQAPGDGPPGTLTGRTQIETLPAVTTTVRPTSVLLASGDSGDVTVTNTDTSGFPATVKWSITPPDGSGLSASPASGTVTLAPGESAAAHVALTASGQGTFSVPIAVSATIDSATEPMPGAYLGVTVPYGSLAAAFNNVGITDDATRSAGDLNSVHDSFDAAALAAAGLAPGATVTRHGFTFTFPDVPAGQKDNVAPDGQYLALPPGTGNVAMLATSVNSASTIQPSYRYADGSTQPVTVNVSYWRNATPSDDNELVASVTTYRADRKMGDGSLFYVPLPAPDASRQPVALVLPSNANVHIFALATEPS